MRAGSGVVVAAVIAVAAACNSSSGSGGEGATNTAPSSTPGVGECLEQGASVPRATPEGDVDAYLVDVRVTRLDLCSDEVVFEFRSSGGELPPGYEIGYEPGPFRDFTSGDEFDPAGEAYLVIRFRRTGTVEVVVRPEGEPDFRDTFDLGRESIAPSDMNHLQEARIVEGPERTVQWVIGVDSERPFTADASTLPMPLPPETPAPAPATSRIVVTIG
ncbi:MAG: AMIN-like domain-containing (lipo)protein [Acidimicrobiia bacterium]